MGSAGAQADMEFASMAVICSCLRLAISDGWSLCLRHYGVTDIFECHMM